MSEILGETAFLTKDTQSFSGVINITGIDNAGSKLLKEVNGIKQKLAGHAFATIIEDTLRVSVAGPLRPDAATTVQVCLVPSSLENLPTTAQEIMTVSGNVKVSDSLYNTDIVKALNFPEETNHQLKPVTVVGSEPKLVWSSHVEGGEKGTVVQLLITGSLKLSGIGFTQTW